jgi:hypothetical protein
MESDNNTRLDVRRPVAALRAFRDKPAATGRPTKKARLRSRAFVLLSLSAYNT